MRDLGQDSDQVIHKSAPTQFTVRDSLPYTDLGSQIPMHLRKKETEIILTVYTYPHP